MKILKVEFQNINALKGKHEIDFSTYPFTSGALFAITGPTGSGKSSILDVISLALFNNIPRIDRISKGEIVKTGAIITRSQKEAMAAVTYQCNAGKFRSEWQISTARTGNLREYDMQISKVETGALLDLKKSEVPEKNEMLIGLNYNQFIKSVLLAQGEFARFLKAKKEERGELLEKITGTGIYRKLGILAFQKHKSVNLEIESRQNRLEALKDQLLNEDDFKESSASLKVKEKREKNLQEALEKIDKNIELKKNIEHRLQEINHTEKQKNQFEIDLKDFQEQYGKPLLEHEKIEDLAEELRDWNLLKREIEEIKSETEKINSQQEKNRNNLTNILQATSVLIAEEVNQENILDKLSAFQKKITGIQEEIRAKLQHFKAIANQIRTETRSLDFQLNEKSPDTNREALLKIKTKAETTISKISDYGKHIDFSDTAKEKEYLKQQAEMARKAGREQDQLNTLSEEINKSKTEQKSYQLELKSWPKQIKEARMNRDLYHERLEKLKLQQQHQLLQAKFEEQRHILDNGKPCPLCGAIEHPFAKNLPAKDISLDKKIAETEKLLNQWNAKFTSLKTQEETLQNNLKKWKMQEVELQENLKKVQEDFDNKYNRLTGRKAYENWEDFYTRLQQELNLIEELEAAKNQKNATETALPLLENLQQTLLLGKELRAKLENLYSGDNIGADIGDLSKKWISGQEKKKQLLENKKNLQEKNKGKETKFTQLENTLLPQLEERGFPTINNARKALMPEAQTASLRNRRKEIDDKITATKSSLEILQKQFKEYKKHDINIERQELESDFQKKKQEKAEIAEACKDLFSKLSNHKQNQKSIEKIQEEIAETEKKIRPWRLLNELIGDAKGKIFNDYAQNLSLSRLLYLANVRLADLSDRYKIDKPNDEEDDALVAIDEHMGGQRRSVKTLSGGETFLLSLSMALALSDMASQNVEINSLFIDEGFGTLDPETLDQTLDTLEKLQAESSKTIGIISHVESLKERIATQIQLKRNGQGYSSLEIKA